MDVEPMDVEQLLRENLAHRADDVAPPPRDLHDRTLAGARHQRRRLVGVAAGTVAAALLVGWIGWLGPETAPPTAQPASGPVATAGGGSPEPTDEPLAAGDGDVLAASTVLDLPTRGSLAHDLEFLAGLGTLAWPGGASEQPEDAARQVLFAGEVPGGQRWALVGAHVRGQPVAVWYVGPPGAAGNELTAATPPLDVLPGVPLSLLDVSGEAGPIVVVAWPGDQIQYYGGTGHLVPGAIGPVPVDLTVEGGTGMGVVERPEPRSDGNVWITRGTSVSGSVPAHIPSN